jgi:hypothetical protein
VRANSELAVGIVAPTIRSVSSRHRAGVGTSTPNHREGVRGSCLNWNQAVVPGPVANFAEVVVAPTIKNTPTCDTARMLVNPVERVANAHRGEREPVGQQDGFGAARRRAVP